MKGPREVSASKLKVTQIGNSLGVVLPKDLVAELGVNKGDELFITRSPEGHVLTPANPDFERQMKAARKVMKKYRNTLRELAK